MKTTLLRGTALFALAIPVTVQAQSTGSIEFDQPPIVVTGARATSISGFEIPETPKARQVLDAEAIRAQRPGQTINDIINLIPGVSFQNNDPWGSSGGGFTIRGFTSDRISQTLDGLPLNDSGNYALYTNQQVDPEILESVSVNLGVTDVDSPTASAVGGTINLRTRVPSDDFAILASGSYGNILAEGSGDRPYYRIFGMVDSGDITGIGTSAFFSASYVHYDNPFNNYGVVDKQQYNARIYQRIGTNGDFVSVAGHYNQNRNNFFGSFSLQAFPTTREDRFYDINFPCTVDAPTSGVADIDNNCGAEFDRRFNPSNTGNIRGASRFTLAEGLVLTVDPSYQYVKANGGGDEELLEQTFDINGTPYTGFIRGGYYFGRDLNGDGDVLDEVTGHDPSQTQTHRFGVISSLAYDINDWHRLRLAYTWDRARHRQTGATSVALPDGEIADVFPINDPLVTADGFVLNKRDRLSYAILHQVSAEYRGQFFDEALTVSLGLRAPFFTRRLNQYCYTTSAGGFLDCIGTQDPTAYEAANPNAAAPQSRTYNYDRLLPNVGFVYDVSDVASIFFNYAQGLSVPGTDPLYNSLFFADPDAARPAPETTDSFDLGMRFQGPTFQGQIAAWYTRYENRLASAYDPILDTTVYRNLGVVDKYGIDGSIAWHPTPNTLLYLFGSYTESEIQDDIQNGVGTFLDTAGRRESGSPQLTYGARGEIRFGNLQIGLQAKHTGERYINDENLPIAGYPSATVGGYTLVDFDMRYDIMELPTGGNMSVQLNLTNLFDELYVGSFGGSLSASSSPFVQIGPPRAGSISLIVGF
ncbi:TonB-dependent receptor [Parasphingopyxis marina]|uniref:TonB-dependent receptor n=1 Tax=Parasphingopyxis marina TaxID=2761622 RepID=A0A842HZV0_9SPHN|nr:TonB-dependent receptor [Parasphingopyxis marina]MBC2778405.1 TonB-dependent receptor [Parasphingopyxis marina]